MLKSILLVCMYMQRSSLNTITVDQKSGRDDRNCTKRLNPCRSLNYVFVNSTNMLNQTTIVLNQGVHELNERIELEYISDLSIISSQYAVINCSSINTGLIYKYVKQVRFENITIQNCGVFRQSTTIIYDGSESLQEDSQLIVAGVTFIYSNSITVTRSKFLHNKGVALAFFDVGLYVKIEHSYFSTNLEGEPPNSRDFSSGGGIHIEYTHCGALPPFNCSIKKQREYNYNNQINITNTVFESNSAENRYNFSKPEIPLNKTYITFGKGGAVSIYIFDNAKNNTFLFNECRFSNNQALWGGAMGISFKDESESNEVLLRNVIFENNKATYAGGALRIESLYVDDFNHYTQPRKLTSGNIVNIQFSNFTNNSAIWGGGLSIEGTTRLLYIQNPEDSNYLVRECNFVNNRATVGFAIGLSTINLNPDVTGPGMSYHLIIENCIFKENLMILTEDKKVIGHGTLYSEQAPVILKGANSFFNNNNTVVVLDSSSLYFAQNSNVTFDNNNGIEGGAIALYGLSWILLGENTTLLFRDNVARVRGGAICAKSGGPTRVSFETTELSTSGCFIRYENNQLDPDLWPVSVIFSGNEAPNGTGNSVYASTLQHCRRAHEYRNQVKALNWTSIKYLKNKNGYAEIVTNAIDIQIKEDQWDAYPFLPFNPDITLLDERSQSVYGSIRLSLSETVKLDPPNNVFLIRNKLARLRITGNSFSRFMFQFSSTSGQIFKSPVFDGHLKRCPAGFKLDDRKEKCECMDDTSIDVIHCLENGTVYILKERWGYISTTTGNLETKLCPSHYCRCNKETIDYLCALDIDNQCQPNRHGRLCSQCKEGLSVVLGSEECKTCPNKWLAMLLLLVVGLSLLVVAILCLKVDAFSGYLNAFFYSYQMVLLLIPGNIKLDPFISFIIGITGFSGTGGSFGICIFNGMDNLDKLAMNYVAPGWMVAFTWFVGLCIPWSLCDFRFCWENTDGQAVDSADSRKRRRDSFGRALCFVIVISYSAFTGTTMKLFKYVHIDGHKYVYDAAFQQYGRGKHVGYLILASVICLLIVASFPVVIIFQVSIAKRFPQLLRFDRIFETLKTCFKEHLRSFASFYFICRLAMLAAFIFIEEKIPRLLVLTIMSLVITLIFTYLKPYQDNSNNIWDIVLLTNLCIIGFLSLIISVPFVMDQNEREKVIVSIKVFVYLPLVVAIGRLVWHLWHMWKWSDEIDQEDGRRDTGIYE